MSCSTITIGSSQVVWLGKDTDTGLQDAVTGAWINDATVTGTLYEEDRVTSLGVFTLTYQATSNGEYIGTIDSSVTALLSQGTTYFIKVVAVENGTNTQPFWLEAIADY